MPEIEDPRQYLLDWLSEEFSRYPEVRVRLRPPQESDGVSVKTESREYFFETEWVRARQFDEIQKLAIKIREFLDR